MRILVVGAGAVGGYFGGRVLAAGGDVEHGQRTEHDHLIDDFLGRVQESAVRP